MSDDASIIDVFIEFSNFSLRIAVWVALDSNEG
jgi:hypothetical protein